MPNPNFKYNYETRVQTVMKVLKQGNRAQVARETGIPDRTIKDWMKTYRDEAERRLRFTTVDSGGTPIVPAECDRPNDMDSHFRRSQDRRRAARALEDVWVQETRACHFLEGGLDPES